MKYTFELNQKERETYEKWYLEKVYECNKKHPVRFEFTQTGIGVCVKARCGFQVKDITDYDSW